MGDSRLVHGAKTRRLYGLLHLDLGMKRKRREEKMAEASNEASDVPLGSWALAVMLADSLSDCGLIPTLPEFDCSRRWFFAPLF